MLIGRRIDFICLLFFDPLCKEPVAIREDLPGPLLLKIEQRNCIGFVFEIQYILISPMIASFTPAPMTPEAKPAPVIWLMIPPMMAWTAIFRPLPSSGRLWARRKASSPKAASSCCSSIFCLSKMFYIVCYPS